MLFSISACQAFDDKHKPHVSASLLLLQKWGLSHSWASCKYFLATGMFSFSLFFFFFTSAIKYLQVSYTYNTGPAKTVTGEGDENPTGARDMYVSWATGMFFFISFFTSTNEYLQVSYAYNTGPVKMGTDGNRGGGWEPKLGLTMHVSSPKYVFFPTFHFLMNIYRLAMPTTQDQ